MELKWGTFKKIKSAYLKKTITEDVINMVT